ncbi:hypothetical protein MNAN1_003669 [Malassezia nana]|uniref:Uncharacterized protein n=1 Tax=Malassezia nana TaxID=180528 RepID=A0AAF0J3Y3_9BASI|nr:hypothetical protein MNAN1_003669 [Malassezia nana]
MAESGGFIASMGLESFYSHGFMTQTPQNLVASTIDFVEYTLANYTHSVLPYMLAAYDLTHMHLNADMPMNECLERLAVLDWHHHTLLLNHVARRASMIQGMALLSLYMRSFVTEQDRSKNLMEELRLRIRRGGAKLNNGALALTPSELAGHLPICTGAFSCCLGLSKESMLRLNLFLQARNIMSCSIRLNTLGPYKAHQLLGQQLRQVVEQSVERVSQSAADKLVAVSMPGRSVSPTDVLCLDDVAPR